MKPHLRIAIQTLLKHGVTQREIERRTGVDRKTIRRHIKSANSSGVAAGSEGVTSEIPPPRPPALEAGNAKANPLYPPSACEPHRAWIEAQVQLGRNAQSIYQDLVNGSAFTHRYNSVKRFVAALKSRAPARFDVLEFLPGEEAQVDYGQGALTRYRPGKYKRPLLFIMTLKYSGKSFRKVVSKSNQEVWAQLHEEAWRAFGGSTCYVVLDNLKEGVIKPDIYEPALNPLYAALLAHYGVVADPCRVRDPNRKGTVENAIQHTQSTALKGRRFESIEAQNAFLAHWEERWAALRIHGRKKRQVMEMYLEERPHLRPLPLEGFRYFKQGTRTVDDAGLVAVEKLVLRGAARAAVQQSHGTDLCTRDRDPRRRGRRAAPAREIGAQGQLPLARGGPAVQPLARDRTSPRPGEKIGPNTARFARELFAKLGRPGQRALYGLANLPRCYARADIDAVCAKLLEAQCVSYATVKHALERRAATACTSAPATTLTQSDPIIRAVGEYQAFWENHSQLTQKE